MFAVLAIAIIGIEARSRTQIFGRKSENSKLIRRENVRQAAHEPDAIVRASIFWPHRGDTTPERIGAVVVVHREKASLSNARITSGGIGQDRITVGFTSAAGRPIDSVVELWSQ